MKKESTIIAVTGKGGVGKTSLSAVIVKELVLAHPDKKILAIDADPAVGLAVALGIEVTSTIDDIRQAFVAYAEEGNTSAAVEMLSEARYRIFDALVEQDHFSFLAIGRPESAGCYCKVNAYLKQVISILADNFDYVVIDGEAGIEQVNRRVMDRVTHLIFVSDASRKGIQVVSTIKEVADKLISYQKCGVILNRLNQKAMESDIDLNGLELLSKIPQDDLLQEYDMNGDNVFNLDENARIVAGAKTALEKLGVI